MSTGKLEHPSGQAPGTLGAVLYANAPAPADEREWAAMVGAVAAGDLGAVHGLYERMRKPVFTLALRLTSSRVLAEDLTIDVFGDLSTEASRYAPATDGTVVA